MVGCYDCGFAVMLYAEILKAEMELRPRDNRQRVKLTLAENMFISINNIYKFAAGHVWAGAAKSKTRTKPPIKIIFAI